MAVYLWKQTGELGMYKLFANTTLPVYVWCESRLVSGRNIMVIREPAADTQYKTGPA